MVQSPLVADVRADVNEGISKHGGGLPEVPPAARYIPAGRNPYFQLEAEGASRGVGAGAL
jgi:hypothetical protein